MVELFKSSCAYYPIETAPSVLACSKSAMKTPEQCAKFA